jgi:hypothetical protein
VGCASTAGTAPSPTAALSANPAAIAAGQTSVLTWSSSNATRCTAGGGWSGDQGLSGAHPVTPTATTLYTLACAGAGGTATESATVTVAPPPTLTLTATPTQIAAGESSTLRWTSTDATGCTAGGGWSGSRASNDSASVSPTATTTYALTCTGTGGSASDSVTVTVGAGPGLTFTATPSVIAAGQSSTLAWSSSNAASCTASGGWTGSRSVSGSETVSPTATTTYTLSCTGTGGSVSRSVTVTVTGTTTPGYVYPLAVGSAGRHLVDQNGKPFFLVGDAAWSLISQLSDQDADTYLADRQQRGFTAVLVNLIEHKFATNAPADIYGISPFTGQPFTTPNDAYFAHADYIIASAAQKGIVVLLAPLYLGVNCGSEGWCAEVQAASAADLTAWGQYVGNRYRGFDNIVWVIGGDTDPSSVKTKVQAFVNGLVQEDTLHLLTAHNDQEQMAITPWAGASWLTVNDVYTYSTTLYQPALTAYHVSPPMPYFLIESAYENEHGSTAQQLRAQSYWTVLSGGFGHVFGNCPIWGFADPAMGSFCSITNWQAQLSHQGSVNMDHLQHLFTSRHWYDLVPDESHRSVTAGYGTYGQTNYATAAYASDGSSIIAYLPTSRTVTVSFAALAGDSVTGWWYNPATGAATQIGTYASSGSQNFTPPSSGDWVLVVDGSSFSFPEP